MFNQTNGNSPMTYIKTNNGGNGISTTPLNINSLGTVVSPSVGATSSSSSPILNTQPATTNTPSPSSTSSSPATTSSSQQPLSLLNIASLGTLKYNNVYQFKEFMHQVLESRQFGTEWITMMSNLFSNENTIFRKCHSDEECRELLMSLRPSSELFKVLMQNFDNDLHEFIFLVERLPKSTIYETITKKQPYPKIVNDLTFTESKRDVILNVFQYYFFLFGLFCDSLSLDSGTFSFYQQQLQQQEQQEQLKGRSLVHHRSIQGVPGNFSSKFSSSVGSNTTKNNGSSGLDRSKMLYNRLLREYLGYFLPYSKSSLDGRIIVDPSRKITPYPLESVTFLKIICDCLMGHNLSNASLLGLNPFYLNTLSSKFKKPTMVYLDSISTLINHYHFYSYSLGYPGTMSSSSSIDTVYVQHHQIVRQSLLEFLVSFLEKFEPYDSHTPFDRVLNIWISFITPWELNFSPKSVQKSSSLQNIFHTFNNNSNSNTNNNSNSGNSSQTLSALWERFIMDNYYMYSMVFSFILFCVPNLDITRYSGCLRSIISIFNSPPLLSLLKLLSTHDLYLLSFKKSSDISSNIINILESQLQSFPILRGYGQERNLFSPLMSDQCKIVINSLSSQMNFQNKLEIEDIIKKLSNIYDFKIPEFKKDLKENNSISPERNQDGTLTDAAKRDIYEGKKICRVFDPNYPYEKFIYSPETFENLPITSNEIGFLIRLTYNITDNRSIRIFSRKLFRYRTMSFILLFLFIVYILFFLLF
ncbi:hypothetical protein CYY_001943 [Polysphondylium violaceum]|uniref:Uncharacterized protein n=1 Tax=Polysphondylium violaceum TaxID=133409 RepID=A0A8J4VA39_9MYCE|nr:hypothetical protein CYY_001943 [Polysphondylium violaceum]